MKIISEIKELPNGKKALFVEGKPFQTYGMQLRLDRFRNNAHKENKDLEGLFKVCKELHVNTVQVVVTWKEIEPGEGIYDFTNIKFAVNQCEENNLKMEIIWFGSNVCGSGWDNFTPDWMISDRKRFYLMVDQKGEELAASYIHPMDGRKHAFCVENDELLVCEGKVITQMLKYLECIDRSNTVIGFQVENEPSIVQHNPEGNMTDRCHCSKCDDLYKSGKYANPQQFSKERLAIYLNKIASFIKNSPLKIITRVNFICWYWDIDEDVGFMRRYAPMVDFVGYDNYGSTLAKEYDLLINDLSREGNVPHISEASGDESNQRERIISTISADAIGYEVYQLAPATEKEDNCILNADLTYKDHRAEDIRKTYKLLGEVMSKIAIRRRGCDICYFNIGSDCAENFCQSAEIGRTKIEYSTQNYGIGIAFEEDGWLVLLSSNKGCFYLQCHLPTTLEYGNYDANGVWIVKYMDRVYTEEGEMTSIYLEDSIARLKT